MGRTIDVMKQNEPDKPRVAVPAEYARAEWVLDNPPSAVALKALSVVFASARGDIEGLIAVPFSELRRVPGVAGMSASDVAAMARSLMMAHVSSTVEVEPGLWRDRFGPIIAYAEVDRRPDRPLTLRLQFGPAFVRLAQESDVYALLDQALMQQFQSRPAILLYQRLASLWRMAHIHSVQMTVEEWRRALGVADNVHKEFKAFNRKVLQPAVAEVSDLSPFTLEVRWHKQGRAVSAIEVVWRPKQLGPVALDKADDSEPADSPIPEATLRALAEKINAPGPLARPDLVTPRFAKALIKARMVSPEQLQAKGLTL